VYHLILVHSFGVISQMRDREVGGEPESMFADRSSLLDAK
jgi:hypothetical protein